MLSLPSDYTSIPLRNGNTIDHIKVKSLHNFQLRDENILYPSLYLELRPDQQIYFTNLISLINVPVIIHSSEITLDLPPGAYLTYKLIGTMNVDNVIPLEYPMCKSKRFVYELQPDNINNKILKAMCKRLRTYRTIISPLYDKWKLLTKYDITGSNVSERITNWNTFLNQIVPIGSTNVVDFWIRRNISPIMINKIYNTDLAPLMNIKPAPTSRLNRKYNTTKFNLSDEYINYMNSTPLTDIDKLYHLKHNSIKDSQYRKFIQKYFKVNMIDKLVAMLYHKNQAVKSLQNSTNNKNELQQQRDDLNKTIKKINDNITTNKMEMQYASDKSIIQQETDILIASVKVSQNELNDINVKWDIIDSDDRKLNVVELDRSNLIEYIIKLKPYFQKLGFNYTNIDDLLQQYMTRFKINL